jgi:NADPH-dependent glutamate synthase beta subunit-like oxidoreductase
MQLPECHVDLIDKLPSPFGLIRTGIAPDHQMIKKMMKEFDRLGSKDEKVRFLGNIEIGKNLSVSLLRKLYSGVIFAHGAESNDHLLSSQLALSQ